MISTVSLQLYDAARRHAGLVDRYDYGHIVVAGRDRASYLNGLFTNDITSLQTGRGCYSAYLTPQGRMITDLWVYELGDVILLKLRREVKDTLLAKLDQFIFSEDVQLGDVSQTFRSVAVIGPEAAAVVAKAVGRSVSEIAAMAEDGNLRTTFRDQPAILLRVTDLGEPGYDVIVDGSQHEILVHDLHENGAVDLDGATAETLRIESGIPLFHRDMNEETIPLEAGIESRAISQTKGCYVGQEVIIRVLHRGHGRVARKLVGLVFEDGDAPAAGSPIRAADKAIGEVTSATWSPALKRPIALGYVHREFIASGTVVSVDGRAATVAPLPLVVTH